MQIEVGHSDTFDAVVEAVEEAMEDLEDAWDEQIQEPPDRDRGHGVFFNEFLLRQVALKQYE